MKFGLNIGTKNQKSQMPCNICFNSKLGNPLIENKPGSFHWCPVFHNKKSIITIGNFSPKKIIQNPHKSPFLFIVKKILNSYKKQLNSLQMLNIDLKLEKTMMLNHFLKMITVGLQ